MAPLKQPVAPIKVEAPPSSILTAARRLPAGTNWRGGIAHLPNGCSSANNWPTCDVDEAPEPKCAPTDVSVAEFDSWQIYVPDGCDVAPFWTEDWNARSAEALEAYTAWALSRELDTGAATANPSLRSTADDISGAGAVNVSAAISTLIRARVEAGFGGVMTAHIPAWLIPPALDHYQLEPNGPATTSLGLVRVSLGPGYTGIGPTTTGNVVPAAGQGYIYMTGPVEYELSPVESLLSDHRDQNLRTNMIEAYAERFAIYRFDPCGVFAVLASVE